MACKSCLSKLSYEDLKCFEWENIKKMIFHHPRLLKTLLVIFTGENKVDNEHHYLFLELGLIYGILIKRRSHILSQVQRVIAVAIAQETFTKRYIDHYLIKLFHVCCLPFCTILWKFLELITNLFCVWISTLFKEFS